MIVPDSSTKRSLAEATQGYHAQLIGSPAEHYLIEDRGITRTAVEVFSLGYVAEALVGHEGYAGCLVVPYHTPTGITTIRFRRLPPNETPKYLTITGDVVRLFNPGVLASAAKVAICEGEIDAITCHDAAIPACGVPGAESWNPIWARAFRYREVTVLADGDDNGQGMAFAQKVARSIDRCRIVLMDGMDVNSYYLKFGGDALRKKAGWDG